MLQHIDYTEMKLGGFLVMLLNGDISGSGAMNIIFLDLLYGTNTFLIQIQKAHMCDSFLPLHIQESGPLNMRNKIRKRRKEAGQTNQL